MDSKKDTKESKEAQSSASTPSSNPSSTVESKSITKEAPSNTSLESSNPSLTMEPKKGTKESEDAQSKGSTQQSSSSLTIDSGSTTIKVEEVQSTASTPPSSPSSTWTSGSETLIPGTLETDDDIPWQEMRRKKAKVYGGKYLKGDLLGKGSFAAVNEVLDIRNLQRKAVKRFNINQIAKFSASQDMIKMIFIEAQLMKTLNHKNILKVFDVIKDFEMTERKKFREDSRVYVIMEYCTASVEDIIQSAANKKLPKGQAHFYFVGLIEALHYLQCNGIVHKDIKPHNLLITLDGQVKLADFGISVILDRFAKDDTIKSTYGTKLYLPPEVYASKEDLSFAGFPVDVWAAGITLYRMITGLCPFEDDNELAVMQMVISDDFPLTPDIESDYSLESLLVHMLLKNPVARITVNEIRTHPWYTVNHSNVQFVRIPTRGKFGDEYNSMTITPYLHQLHCPIDSEQNKVTVTESTHEKISHQISVPIVRGHREQRVERRGTISRESMFLLDNRVMKILGFRQLKKAKRYPTPDLD